MLRVRITSSARLLKQLTRLTYFRFGSSINTTFCFVHFLNATVLFGYFTLRLPSSVSQWAVFIWCLLWWYLMIVDWMMGWGCILIDYLLSCLVFSGLTIGMSFTIIVISRWHHNTIFKASRWTSRSKRTAIIYIDTWLGSLRCCLLYVMLILMWMLITIGWLRILMWVLLVVYIVHAVTSLIQGWSWLFVLRIRCTFILSISSTSFNRILSGFILMIILLIMFNV